MPSFSFSVDCLGSIDSSCGDYNNCRTCWRLSKPFIPAAREGGLHLLNTTIIPSFPGDFTIIGGELPQDEASDIIFSWTSRYGNGSSIESHVGHQSTADLMAAICGVPVPMSRAPWDGSGAALICALAFRGEEGRIYTAEELAAFAAAGKIQWRWMVITRF